MSSETQDIDHELEIQKERLHELLALLASRRILSTLPFSKATVWTDNVDTLAPNKNVLSRFTKRVGIPDVSVFFKLIARAHRYDLVLLTGGERVDLLYLAVAGLLPWLHTPHVIVDAHWQKSERAAAYLLQRLILRLGRRLTVQVQPHSTEEIAIYHDVFGIPLDTLHPVPFSTSLIGYDVSPATPSEAGNFVLSGGLSYRDYDTLIEAFKSTELGDDVGLEIGLPNEPASLRIVEMARGLPNVTVHTDWTNAQFIRKMAGCRVFVLPIEAGLTRSTADQTILNAMFFGKIVIATSSIGSRVYIEDGVNGFLVPEKSASAWSDILKRVYALSEKEYQEIGNRAAYTARVQFNEELRLVRTLQAALEKSGMIKVKGEEPRRP